MTRRDFITLLGGADTFKQRGQRLSYHRRLIPILYKGCRYHCLYLSSGESR